MAGNPPGRGPRPSRRDLLRGAGVAVAAGGALAQPAVAQTPAPVPRREALETLTAAEAQTLKAFCARLIPSDANGPGAAEARAAHYIDRALGGALASSRESYRSGLSGLDARARTQHGGAFASLPPAMQDAALTELEQSDPAFFTLVRGHTLQGTFGDPYYGGNANFIGWDLLSYPGIRLAATTEQEKMEPHLKPTHESAYDFSMFNRASAAQAMHSQVASGPLPDGMADMSHAMPEVASVGTRDGH